MRSHSALCTAIPARMAPSLAAKALVVNRGRRLPPGVLPPGVQCLLFDPPPQSPIPDSRVDLDGYPKVLRRAFDDLMATKPERLATTW